MPASSFAHTPRRLLAGGLLCASLMLSGCAFMNPEKRPLLDLMDRRIQPESAWTKVGMMPFLMPVGLTALVGDIFIFRPLGQIPPSAARVKEVYWNHPDEPPGISVVLFLPRAIVATPDFLTVWVLRSFFDLAETAVGDDEAEAGEQVDIPLPEGILPPPDSDPAP